MTSIYCPTTIICVLVVLLCCSSAQEGDLTTTGTVSGSFTGGTSSSTAQSTLQISSGDGESENSTPVLSAATSAPESPLAPTAVPADSSTGVPDSTSTAEAPRTVPAGNPSTTPSMNSSPLSPTASAPTTPNDVSSTLGIPTSEAWTVSHISSEVSKTVSTEGALNVTKFPSSVSPSVDISVAETILPSTTVSNVIVTPTASSVSSATALPTLRASSSTCQTSPPFRNAHDSMTAASASAPQAPSTLPVSYTFASSHTIATSPPLAPTSLRTVESGTSTISTLASLVSESPTTKSQLTDVVQEANSVTEDEDNKSSDNNLPTRPLKTAESQASSLLIYFWSLLIIAGVLLTLTYRKKIIALIKRTKKTSKKYKERNWSKTEEKSLLENEYV